MINKMNTHHQYCPNDPFVLVENRFLNFPTTEDCYATTTNGAAFHLNALATNLAGMRKKIEIKVFHKRNVMKSSTNISNIRMAAAIATICSYS